MIFSLMVSIPLVERNVAYKKKGGTDATISFTTKIVFCTVYQ